MEKTLKTLAKEAKKRMKSGFWEECDADKRRERETGAPVGGRAERLLAQKVNTAIRGEKTDDFYEKVKNLLDTEGEVSDAIGRLTDKPYYDSLDYNAKQKYTMELSERYLKALERYRKEMRLRAK